MHWQRNRHRRSTAVLTACLILEQIAGPVLAQIPAAGSAVPPPAPGAAVETAGAPAGGPEGPGGAGAEAAPPSASPAPEGGPPGAGRRPAGTTLPPGLRPGSGPGVLPGTTAPPGVVRSPRPEPPSGSTAEERLTWERENAAAEGGEGEAAEGDRLNFKDTEIKIVLDDYAEVTGRTLLLSPGIPAAKITLRSQTELTTDEYLQAIESVLAMYGVALIKVGDKFLRVVANKDARQEAMPIAEYREGMELTETDALVSQMIQLKNIDLNEAKQAIDVIKHSYAQIQIFERINSLLVTDTAANINRLLQILKYIDQPVEAREEPYIVAVKYSKAEDIKRKLEEIIAESQKEAEKMKSTIPQQKPTGAPGVVTPPPGAAARTPPGVIRPPTAAPETPAPSQEAAMAAMVEEAERGIIRGKVRIVSDERTNILIIITRPENMAFFEKIIKVLDVATAPEVVVEVILLEYAEAEKVAETLNTLIGQAEKAKAAPAAPGAGGAAGTEKIAPLGTVAEQPRPAAGEEKGKSKPGELSATNVKILPDKRTNSLLVMASRGDFEAIREIVTRMDVMLSQVLVETVIIQVDLSDTLTSGIQWVQRALIAYDVKADGSREAIGAVAGSAGAGYTAQNASTLTSIGDWSTGSGLTTYFTHFGLGIDAILKLVSTDSRSQILSSPIVVTTDNTKATVSSSEQRYFLKGAKIDQYGNSTPETEIRDIGLELVVTPHINRSRNVMMEISQTLSDPGADQKIEDTSWPTTTKRSMTASIAVRDRETIVLGGLVRTNTTRSREKVPLLGDIPLLGRLFSSSSSGGGRAEIVVFVTPYVLDSPEDIAEESRRRKEALETQGVWERGWSESRLADLTRADRSENRKLEKDQARREKEDIKAEEKRKAEAARREDARPAPAPRAQTQVAAPVPTPRPEPAPAAAPAADDNPVSRLDPALRKFIEEQEKRWGNALKQVDEKTIPVAAPAP